MPVNLPLYKKLSFRVEAPVLLEKLKFLDYPFLLDTGMQVNGLGHHSFVGADPFMVLTGKGNRVTLHRGNEVAEYQGSPVTELQRLMEQLAMPPECGLFPLNGGAVGYFSYDLGRQFEEIPVQAVDDLQTPDLCLGFYDTLVAVDVRTNEATIISTGLPERGEAAFRRARQRLEWFETWLSSDTNPPAGHLPGRDTGFCSRKAREMESNFTMDQYCSAAARAVEYIAAGDIFQVNLSQRFTVPQAMDAWTLYRRLRKINPAPFAAYLSYGDMEIISASPERFLKVEGDLVQTCPIKGTRPRGHTPAEDQRLRRELWHSEKDRAELMMIVDLERNDLGRVCQVGSVHVPDLYRLEEYATVFHLVSTVEGRLLPGKGIADLLAATFPGGSITGAPKIRAMEIIEEIEPVRRGIYTGSIGYLGFDGRVDLNIVIRTILATGGNMYFQVGGAVTADSDPYKEYMETLDKARALIRALGWDTGCAGLK
ncbi:aminodeoxychorismate synthase component I [Desulfallas thermosapovorans]|uniref:aminodeoxychorismate synthase n=1 Tax=Desulfallas thermosapovorans DSM 6562 TaxID=1121431 RepID=A0A5S4ZY55_9FIRM|nr:aminodeoxychorismate synthase component I [Desulfallas thermosapovorans]TYO97993.1 para-aminobenzoate synthetase component 1 [Desulfallas thermosapovorans DSM 6562]